MTKLLTEQQINQAFDIIRQGGTVAFRTETVYGLGADATNDTAVRKIFSAKGRPSVNPLIVHFAHVKDIFSWFPRISKQNKTVLLKIKGPLTIILSKQEVAGSRPLASSVTGGLASIAVRVPLCNFSRRLIKACGIPIAAPSANTSGRPSPTRWRDVYDDLNGKVDAIIMGKDTKVGVESTVISVQKNGIKVLRPGGVSSETLTKKTGLPVVSGDRAAKKASPGTSFKHYKPKCPLVVHGAAPEQPFGVSNVSKTIVLCRTKNKKAILQKYPGAKVLTLGNSGREVSRNLFAKMREAEKFADLIICEDFPDTPEFEAVRERISRASGVS